MGYAPIEVPLENLRCFWLGPPVIEWNGRATQLETRKTTALLAYLSLCEQTVPREVLLNLLWPDFDQQHAQANLRRSLFSANHGLKNDTLISERGAIGINPEIPLWVDVFEWRRLRQSIQLHTRPKGNGDHEMQKSEITRFIQAFSGSHRYILDYLGEEVFNHKPAKIKRFLMQTSILDRFSGSLCDAVTGASESQAVLIELERQNLFLIPLDSERCWYRYHHLFLELLRYQVDEAAVNRSTGKPGNEVALEDLHLRAAAWFEEHGLPDETIRHLFAAKQLGRAARMIEKSCWWVGSSLRF